MDTTFGLTLDTSFENLSLALDDVNLELPFGEVKPESGKQKATRRKKAAEDKPVDHADCISTPNLNHSWKRIKGPDSMLDEMRTWNFSDGDCYHVSTIANVDSYTWLKALTELQPLRYVLISTWILYPDALRWMMEMYQAGRIGRFDIYIGDNIEDRSPEAYTALKRILNQCGGRLVIFKNHSKIMAMRGERWDLLIESSANMNEKIVPHFEQTCITVGTEPARLTVERFARIHPTNLTTFAEPYHWDESRDVSRDEGGVLHNE